MSIRFSLCNEVIAHLAFDRQCALAAALGYGGLEIAPGTLSGEPVSLTSAQRSELRRTAEREGIAITGLHYVLRAPAGLSLTSDDPEVHRRTGEHMVAMVDLCADLGGSVIVHGSPAQRALAHATSPLAGRKHAIAFLEKAAARAGQAGVVYCLEPLSPALTDFVTTVDEALEIIVEVGQPSLQTMIDTLATWSVGQEPEELIRRHLPSGHISHVHFNDRNSRAPGQGDCRFGPIVQALLEEGYDGVIGIEPFDYLPDGEAAAARAIGYLQGIREMLEVRR